MVWVSRRALVASGAVLVLCACTEAYRWDTPNDGVYVVREGDTLYNIAWRYGLDHRDLARWNQIGNGALIIPGQRLRLTGTATAPAPSTATRPTRRAATPSAPRPVAASNDPAPGWRWPVLGDVVGRFGTDNGTRTGLLIAAPRGTSVKAAAAGRVVYSGSGLISFGQLLIIKHNETYLSAYGHNERVLVAEGDTVRAGQAIAKIGIGPDQQAALHFEIRKNADPIDPLGVLPRR